MSIFNTILAKLGFGDKKPEVVTSGGDPAASGSAPPAAGSGAAAAPASVAVVDVIAQLEQRASTNTEKLNWRTSIVDLMKLLGLDSSFGARKELATELGCPADKMGDSAQMNMWLHKSVLKKLADNGGNIPRELLD